MIATWWSGCSSVARAPAAIAPPGTCVAHHRAKRVTDGNTNLDVPVKEPDCDRHHSPPAGPSGWREAETALAPGAAQLACARPRGPARGSPGPPLTTRRQGRENHDHQGVTKSFTNECWAKVYACNNKTTIVKCRRV
ncbi:hypothetical protein GCM10012275_47600 [Longimycelium tulufanense]|uniref:Uncharacterized protein n=1 Tax=Longimycelium tulufanense TaxID=907463 RepID=A0A8J3CBW7_9PSEU|nr:hypothetical protein GCM10012275_47600 [Longimycelium tulufanense]